MGRTFEAMEKANRDYFRNGGNGAFRFSALPLEVRHQFEKLKSNILLKGRGEKPKSILFSSYNYGEGTSVVAMGFAQCMAQDKRYGVLLVDANTRNPTLHKTMGSSRPENMPTFSDILARQNEKLDLPYPVSKDEPSFISCGEVRSHPAQSFDHGRFREFVAKVRKHYDLVIFDSSPVGQFYDSVVVASDVDGVILVVEAERTPSYELKRGRELFEGRSIPILGTVLNRRRFHIPNFIFQRFFK
jgi:capsular exopolysaccharide synthesis family protein